MKPGIALQGGRASAEGYVPAPPSDFLDDQGKSIKGSPIEKRAADEPMRETRARALFPRARIILAAIRALTPGIVNRKTSARVGVNCSSCKYYAGIMTFRCLYSTPACFYSFSPWNWFRSLIGIAWRAK